MKHFVPLSKRVAKKKKKKKHLKRKRKIHFSINTEIVKKGQETRRKMCIERKAKRQREEFINSRFYQTTHGQESNIWSLAVKRSLKVKKERQSLLKRERNVIGMTWAMTRSLLFVILAIFELRSLTLSMDFHFLWRAMDNR